MQQGAITETGVSLFLMRAVLRLCWADWSRAEFLFWMIHCLWFTVIRTHLLERQFTVYAAVKIAWTMSSRKNNFGAFNSDGSSEYTISITQKCSSLPAIKQANTILFQIKFWNASLQDGHVIQMPCVAQKQAKDPCVVDLAIHGQIKPTRISKVEQASSMCCATHHTYSIQ